MAKNEESDSTPSQQDTEPVKKPVQENGLDGNEKVEEPAMVKKVNGTVDVVDDNGHDADGGVGDDDLAGKSDDNVADGDVGDDKVTEKSDGNGLHDDIADDGDAADGENRGVESKLSDENKNENESSSSHDIKNEPETSSEHSKDSTDKANGTKDENESSKNADSPKAKNECMEVSDCPDENEKSETGEGKNESVVDTVKDGDDDFTITLNEDEDDDDTSDKDSKSEKNDDAKAEEKADSAEAMETDSDSKEKEKAVSEEKEKSVSNDKSGSNDKEKPAVKSSLPAPPQLTPAPGIVVQVPTQATNMPVLLSTGGSNPVIPAGATIAQQGNQLGYITTVGTQSLFVPIPMSNVTTQPGTTSQVVQQKQPVKFPTINTQPPDLQPKSSWEMMELMRWEIQNRIPDNYNWPVVFHPRKDELSSVTTFLQELGSDVVKEQVYKDIIQIQTKKKEGGELKSNEIDSLEKMKTVYDNTKKKVEHLQLETSSCGRCNFRSESHVIMEFHKDYPHYDPPWDINKGTMQCSLCDFKTRVFAQIIFHMKDVHGRTARFLEKDQYFQCSLCPFSAGTKAKLEKHQVKCTKNFKLADNLQPYFHDVNFCMKNIFYKPRKPLPPKPAPQPAKPVVKAPITQQGTRAQSLLTQSAAVQQQQLLRAQAQARPQLAAQLQQRGQSIPVTVRPPVPGQLQAKGKTPNAKEMSVFEVCEMCGGYVKDRQALRIHFYYAHKVELPQALFQKEKPPLQCEVCKAPYWTTQGLAKHKSVKRHYITSNSQAAVNKLHTLGINQTCFMCLRKVSNLFLHIEQTHGMTMKDLVHMKKCIICGLTANDRKALESHMATSHGVLIKASDFLTDKTPANLQKNLQPASANNSGPKPAKNIGKINFCVFCVIQFADNIQLTVHCMKKHATCKECGMVVKEASFLAKHNCMKANRRCYICGQSNMTPDSYALHLQKHVKSCKVDLEKLSPDQIDSAIEKLKREYKPAVISLDSDEDSDIEVVEPENQRPGPKCSKRNARKRLQAKKQAEAEKNDNANKESESKDKSEDGEEKEKVEGTDENGTIEKTEVMEVTEESSEKENDNTDDKEEKESEKKEGENNVEDKNDEISENDVKDENVETVKDENDGDNENPDVEDGNDISESKDDIDEDKLLANDEDSNISSGSGKRKRPESDIDEDELLREDCDTKKIKLDENESDNKDKDVDMEVNDEDGS